MGKPGRPVSENPRKDRVEIRLNKDESNRLDKISQKFGMNRSDTLRTLVEYYEKNMK